MMNTGFENKVALVTGAGSGMGLAAAQAFAAEGAAVALVDINEEAARTAAGRLVATGHRAIAIPCDVTDEGQVKAMAFRFPIPATAVDEPIPHGDLLHAARQRVYEEGFGRGG